MTRIIVLSGACAATKALVSAVSAGLAVEEFIVQQEYQMGKYNGEFSWPRIDDRVYRFEEKQKWLKKLSGRKY